MAGQKLQNIPFLEPVVSAGSMGLEEPPAWTYPAALRQEVSLSWPFNRRLLGRTVPVHRTTSRT